MTYVDLPSVGDLALFMGVEVSDLDDTAAQSHLDGAVDLVREYTRGRGFSTEGVLGLEPSLKRVVTSYAARSLSNPLGDRRIEFGNFNRVPGSPAGFSLIELQTLNAYRRRAA